MLNNPHDRHGCTSEVTGVEARPSLEWWKEQHAFVVKQAALQEQWVQQCSQTLLKAKEHAIFMRAWVARSGERLEASSREAAAKKGQQSAISPDRSTQEAGTVNPSSPDTNETGKA